MSLCYLIYNTESNSYIGYTTNFKQRLRKHNCEIKGGAKYTTLKKTKTGWIPIVIVRGFTIKNYAMSFEWRMKRYLNRNNKLKPCIGIWPRVKNVFDILLNDIITSKSPRVSEQNLEIILNINYKKEIMKQLKLLFNSKFIQIENNINSDNINNNIDTESDNINNNIDTESDNINNNDNEIIHLKYFSVFKNVTIYFRTLEEMTNMEN